MYIKYRPIVPHIHHCDELYARPDAAIIQTVRDEKKKRKKLREELNETKSEVQKKVAIKEKVEKIALGK